MGTGRADLLFLSLHSWLLLAGHRLSVRTAVLSPLPLGVLSLSAHLYVCLGLGGGSTVGGAGTWTLTSSVWSDYCLPPLPYPSLTLQFELPLESKCGYGFCFFFWGLGGLRGGKGEGQCWEMNSHCSSGAPHRQGNTPHTPVSNFFITKVASFTFSDLLYKTSYIDKLWFVLPFVLGGCFERFPFRQQHMTFTRAACSPAALREHIHSKPSGPL